MKDWKPGDIFEVTDKLNCSCGNFKETKHGNNKYIKMLTSYPEAPRYEILDDKLNKTNSCSCGSIMTKGGLIAYKPYKSSFTMDSIKSAFVNLFTTEPAKSFKKASIINGDNLLTPEGTEVFINWLFNKPENQTGFNDEVVQPILTETKKQEKK